MTSFDVHQALDALTIDYQRSTSSGFEQEQCDCCRFIRTFSSSGVLLPLARRGRPYISNRSPRLLCPNCHKLKQQLQANLPSTSKTSTFVDHTDEFHRLTDQERKILLDELIRKLQIVLNNHPTINHSDETNFQLTYRTLQSTLSLLSSSSSDDPM